MSTTTISDPSFWANVSGAILQAVTLFRSVVADPSSKPQETSDAVVGLLAAFGDPIKHMRAWKHMHDNLQKALDAMEPVTGFALDSRRAADHPGDMRNSWNSFKLVAASYISGGFSQMEADIVRYIHIEDVLTDWRKALRILEEQVDTEIDADKATGASRAIAQYRKTVGQALSQADRILINGIDGLIEKWHETMVRVKV